MRRSNKTVTSNRCQNHAIFSYSTTFFVKKQEGPYCPSLRHAYFQSLSLFPDLVAIHGIPAEAEDGDDDRDHNDAFIQHTAPRADQRVIGQHARRIRDQIRQADLLRIVRPVADRPRDRPDHWKEADPAVPRQQRDRQRQRRKYRDSALPAHHPGRIVLRQHRVAHNVDQQAQTAAERTQQRKLDAECQAAQRLQDQQRAVRLRLKREEEKQRPQKSDCLGCI